MKKILITLIISSLSLLSFGQHPTNLSSSSITANSATCQWTNNGCVNFFKYRATGGSWTVITTNISNPFLLDSLQPLTDYEWTVKCDGIPLWSNPSSFTTIDSASCNLNTIVTINNSTCDGTYDGSASINTSNGIPPYSYLWNNNDTTSSINSVLNGTYITTTTDSIGCSVIDTILIGHDDIKSISQILSTFSDTANPNYPGVINGYHIWAYDTLSIINNGCDINIRPEFIISHSSQPIQQGQLEIRYFHPAFGPMIIPYNIDNNGNAYGFWNLSASDSTGFNVAMLVPNQMIMRVKFLNQAPYGNYTAVWNTKEVDLQGNITQVLTPNDTTTLTLVDCSSLLTYTNQTNITCWSDSNGILSIDSIINGSGNYTYNWTNDTVPGVILSTTNNVTNLTPGNYSCTILDNDWGCSINEYLSISEPSVLSTIENISNVTCFGDSNGVAILTISGGTNPYGQGWNGNNSNNLQEGNYFYTITDANGCTFSDSVNISQPPLLTSTISITDITNCSTQDGAIDLSANGGTGTYSYSWSNNEITEDISNLSSGTYTTIITDTNNCTITDSATINNYNSSISTTLNAPFFNGYNLLCYGDSSGTIFSNTIGGIGMLNFQWSDNQNTINAQNLVAGNYSLIITDSLGCTTTNSFNLTQANPITSNYTTTHISCYEVNDGSAIVNFTGGAIGVNPGDMNYFLNWDTLSYPLPFPNTTFTTSAFGVGVPAGSYIYSATDLNGCSHSDTITITQPDSLYTAYSTSNYNGFEVSCYGNNDATVNIQVNGGTAPFDNYFNGILQNNLTTTNLLAGSYTDSIIDANGCTATNTIILNEPSALNTTLNTTDVSCNGICDGEITSNTSGSVSPYYYLWTNSQNTANISNLCAGNYTLVITDENGCTENSLAAINEPSSIIVTTDSTANIITYGGNEGVIYITTNGGSGLLNTSWTSSNGYSAVTNNIMNLYAGIYYLEITDSNLCSYLDTFELTQPSSLSLSINTINNVSCYDSCNGFINITANGGDSTYAYSWVGPNSFTSSNDDINNLCYGEYIITIDDGITSMIDTINIYQPQPITTVLSVDSIVCYNSTAQAEINVWGGTQPFTYNWSNGDSNNYTIVSAGNYAINVTDTNGCSYSQTFSLSNPDSIFTQTTSSNTNCFGGNNGSIIINITNGGTSPYSFSENNGVTYQSTNTFTNLVTGNYSFLISDDNGCLGTASATIIEPPSITSNAIAIDASCYDYCDGSVSASAFGGTPPFSYAWVNGTSNLCAGFYNVIITDANGCISTNSAIINEPNPLLINIWINGGNIMATNGFSSYQWYDNNNNPITGANDSIFTPAGIGVYYVTVTDTNGCFDNSYSIDYSISSIENYSSNINIFPNPTNGNITIIAENSIQSFALYNTIGNQLLSVDNNENNITETKLDLSTFAKGVYFIKINIDNQIINQRIILQ